jgi:hypothetical protein
MHYLNPVALLGTAFQPPLDPRLIQRERKKLLAELELSGSDSLTLDGATFTKNELLEYFAELEQERVIKYHLAISEDPVLLRFLHTGTIEEGARYREATIYTDPGFTEWLSPYFYSTFIKFVTDCFAQPNAAGMRTILDNKLLMTASDTERAWHFITGILEKNIALFDHYRTRGQKRSPKPMPITTVAAFLSEGYTRVIKQLPDSRFAQLKDRYALNMQHPAIATFNRDPHNRPISVIWIENALDLTISPSAIEIVQEKLDEFNRLLRKKRRRNIVRIVYAVCVLIGMSTAFFQTSDDLPVPAYRRLKPSQPITTPPDTVVLVGDSTVVPIVHPHNH